MSCVQLRRGFPAEDRLVCSKGRGDRRGSSVPGGGILKIYQRAEPRNMHQASSCVIAAALRPSSRSKHGHDDPSWISTPKAVVPFVLVFLLVRNFRQGNGITIVDFCNTRQLLKQKEQIRALPDL